MLQNEYLAAENRIFENLVVRLALENSAPSRSRLLSAAIRVHRSLISQPGTDLFAVPLTCHKCHEYQRPATPDSFANFTLIVCR
jgi:hypothetical protein